MNALGYLTKEPTGCCQVKELLELSRSDKANGTNHVDTLKQWAVEEAHAKGIVLDAEPVKAAA